MNYSYPLMQVYGVEIPTRCFIGGLPYSMTELELNSFFSHFGAVQDCKIITDRNGVSKGYGFVTFTTEQEAADVCAKGNLYYKEKKLNISKAIRRQGGQYSKANQEYVNGQRLLYQSPNGYLLGQAKNGSWIMEEPSPYCQPAKIMSAPPPVFVGGPTAPYLQSPTFYPTLPPPPPLPPTASMPPPYEPLQPPPDTGPLLYIKTCAGHVVPPLPVTAVELQQQQTTMIPDSRQLTSLVIQSPAAKDPPHHREEKDKEKREEEVLQDHSSEDGETATSGPSTTGTTSDDSLSVDMEKCSLTPPITPDREETEEQSSTRLLQQHETTHQTTPVNTNCRPPAPSLPPLYTASAQQCTS